MVIIPATNGSYYRSDVTDDYVVGALPAARAGRSRRPLPSRPLQGVLAGGVSTVEAPKQECVRVLLTELRLAGLRVLVERGVRAAGEEQDQEQEERALHWSRSTRTEPSS